jgi:uncharacterized membrane protein
MRVYSGCQKKDRNAVPVRSGTTGTLLSGFDPEIFFLEKIYQGLARNGNNSVGAYFAIFVTFFNGLFCVFTPFSL